jgi:hypothetical protein
LWISRRRKKDGNSRQAKGCSRKAGDYVEYVVTQEPDADRLYIQNARIID